MSTPLNDATETLENIYKSSSPKTSVKRRQYDRGEESKLLSLPPDVKIMVDRAFYALSFFIAILSGVSIGMNIVFNYKIYILLLIIFLLIMVVLPEKSDYIFYGIGDYVNAGYTSLKGFTNKAFVKINNYKQKLN